MKDEQLSKFGLELACVHQCASNEYKLSPFKGDEYIKDNDPQKAILRYVQTTEYWSDWVLLEWVSSSGEDFEDHSYRILAYGEGPGGFESNLREARHTYIGEEGYVFYIKPENLIWCFDKLKKYFDFD